MSTSSPRSLHEQAEQPEELIDEAQQPTTSGRSPPRYANATGVQPKLPLQEYRNADDEAVKSAYSNTSLTGIRSLPNALQPEFRQKLYEDLVETAKLERQGKSPKKNHELQNASARPVSCKLREGTKIPAKYSPISGAFSTFTYMSSEYDREKLMARFEKLKNKLKQGANGDFVVRATPSAPKSAPAFNEFEYVEVPYEMTEETRKSMEALIKTQCIDGPFVAGGKYKTVDNLKGLCSECIRAIAAQLSNDWPTSFLQVFEDTLAGSLVITFDRTRASSEGDLSTYMNHMAKNSKLAADFLLAKDAIQWGLVDSESPAVFYVLWPPWVHHKALVPPQLAGPIPHNPVNFLETSGIAKASNRVPFGDLTPSGLLTTTNTGLFTRSLRF